jgi:hypothetical protein
MSKNKTKLDTPSPAFAPSKNKTPSMTQTKQLPRVGNQKGQYKRHNDRPSQQDQDEFDLNINEEMLAGNLKVRGKRAQISINHLLDFSLPSRDLVNSSKPPPRRRRKSSHDEGKIHLVGKEFINANYRFVVDFRGDYRAQVFDPNSVIDDSKILSVIVPKGHQCPICLSEEIVAPRMISCGHIFCQTCLYRLLDSEQATKKHALPRRYKDCPLCSLPVRPDETKLVLIDEALNLDTPKPGEFSNFKLIAKGSDSILTIPYDLELNRSMLGSVPWYSEVELYPYLRIMKGGLKFVIDSLERDKSAIMTQYEEDKLLYNDNGIYTNKALDEIELKKQLLRMSFDDDFNEPPPLEWSSETASNAPLSESHFYFYYQTAFTSSTKFFLSPLDVKVLLHTFGSYSHFPPNMSLKVENVSYGHAVTDSNIKRLKFLSHLPLGTEFALIDIDWKDTIDPDIYKKFSRELIERKRKLMSRRRKEDHDKKRYEYQQEEKTKQFYMQENNGWGSNDFFGSTTSFANDPELDLRPLDSRSESQPGNYTTTVWGTKIPKSNEEGVDDDDYDPFNTDELLKSLQATTKQRKSKKKKVVLVSSRPGARS